MKLQTIIENFGVPTIQGEPERAGNRVFRMINDFARRVELMPIKKELNEIAKDYETKRQEKVNELVREYCEEQNKANKDKEDYKPLIPEQQERVAPTKMPLLFAWIGEAYQTEVKVKPFKFRPEEIKSANLSMDELEAMADFYDMKALQEYLKDKK